MKKATIILGIIFILLIGFIAYFFIGGALNVQIKTITASAADYPDAFNSIVSVLESGSAPQYFSTANLGSADQYTLIDVTLSLKNPGIFSADWLDIQVQGVTGDVAVYSLTGIGTSIDSRSDGQINLKLITSADPKAIRTYDIQYYVYGMKRHLSLSQ